MPVHDPGPGTRMEFWGENSRRDLRALAADPVFGPRLEAAVHDGPRPWGGTAISRLPRTPEIAAEAHTRIEQLLDALRGGGLVAAGTEAAVTAVTWALAERPVGDPAAGGARALIDLLTGAPAELRAALRALADRSLATPVPPGQYEANPLFSVPDLVDEVASALGVGRDAAALHLRLHAPDRPADRSVRRWNGWTPDHHRAVRGELTAAKAPRPVRAAPAALPSPAHERFARAWKEGTALPRAKGRG